MAQIMSSANATCSIKVKLEKSKLMMMIRSKQKLFLELWHSDGNRWYGAPLLLAHLCTLEVERKQGANTRE